MGFCADGGQGIPCGDDIQFLTRNGYLTTVRQLASQMIMHALGLRMNHLVGTRNSSSQSKYQCLPHRLSREPRRMAPVDFRCLLAFSSSSMDMQYIEIS